MPTLAPKPCRIVIALVAVLACARPSTLPVPKTPSTQPPDSGSPQSIQRENNSPKFWQLSPTSEDQRYSTVITTTIQQKVGEVTVFDSVTTRAQYSISFTHSATEVLLSGLIQAFTAQAGTRIGTGTAISSLPVAFTGQIQNHELQLNILNSNRLSTASLPCEMPATTALTAVQASLFVTPLHLQTGMTWQDSLSSTSCSGNFPLNLTILRTYKVLGQSFINNIPVIAIDLTEKTLSAGEGSQGQHRIIINGQAAGSGQLYLDTSTGALISFSSDTQTTLQIQSSGRTQQFLQNSKQVITRI